MRCAYPPYKSYRTQRSWKIDFFDVKTRRRKASFLVPYEICGFLANAEGEKKSTRLRSSK